MSRDQVSAIQQLTSLAQMDPDERKRHNIKNFQIYVYSLIRNDMQIYQSFKAERSTQTENAGQQSAPWVSILQQITLHIKCDGSSVFLCLEIMFVTLQCLMNSHVFAYPTVNHLTFASLQPVRLVSKYRECLNNPTS